MSCGGVPGVAVLGGDTSQLRRRGGRWRLRDWRLRTKLTALLLVPLVLAGVLGALRVIDSLRQAEDLDGLQQRVMFAQQVGAAVHALQAERQLMAEALAAGNNANRTKLEDQTQRVDGTIDALLSAGSRVGVLGDAAGAYHAALGRLSGLREQRRAALASSSALASPVEAENSVNFYTDLVLALLELNGAVLEGTRDPVARQADAVEALAVAKDQLSQQHAILLAAILSGGLSTEQQSALRTTEARYAAALDEFDEAVSAEQRTQHAEIMTDEVVADRQRLLNLALDQALQEAPLGIVATEWDTAAAEATDRIRRVETTLLDDLRIETATLSNAALRMALRDAALVGALLLLAVLLLVIVLRSLLRPLRTLRTAAFAVADRRLPEAVEKLRITDETIGETVVDPVPVYSRDEVGQVARAFDTVHVQAVRLAAEQAMLRSTINDIFLNLAGRSQRLVERQLKLIDKLGGGEQNPEQLSNLFQLDHLATRMRRNNENLLVLAGGELRRGDERGIAVLDMLRAAISEVAEYQRVALRPTPAATLTGAVAGDLVHLIAELLDNATTVGPSDMPVTLSSELTEDGGLLVEIVDCGTGLPPGELHEINERLASPPPVDTSLGRQMGLFVVSRLAARHGIRVQLRQQRGRFGITATVQLPPSLVSLDPAPSPDAPAPEALTTTEWIESDAELPVQVSVVEGTDTGELLSPSSIEGLTVSPRGRLRTAEQEWKDLFGYAEPSSASAPTGPGLAESGPVEPKPAQTHSAETHPVETQFAEGQPAESGPRESTPAEVSAVTHAPEPTTPVQPSAPAAGNDLTSVPRSGDFGTAEETRQEVRAEIFEQVSAWFRERQSAPVSTGVAEEEMATPPNGLLAPLGSAQSPATVQEWRSAGDDGWNAANALRTPVDYGLTPAGLPRRRPRAHLVPGAAGPSNFGPAPAPTLARTPEDIRGRLTSYQRGLQHGRHARLAPDEQSVRTSIPQGAPEEDQQ